MMMPVNHAVIRARLSVPPMRESRACLVTDSFGIRWLLLAKNLADEILS
jgi:hypothetical protein